MATTNKYDRQLRLWGAKGQKALAETTVVLIRATAAGTETLKNLVLPGVGNIYILDDAVVDDQDATSNFFVTGEKGSPRAQVALELLQELNPDVKGTCHHMADGSLESYKFEEDEVLKQPNVLVIGADLEPPLWNKVASHCATTRVPLVLVQSYGLMGLVRLQTPPLALFDPKPDASKPDLRLVTPFASFVAYCNSIDLDALDDKDHGHIPYPVLLYKLAEDWKTTHEGKLPSTFAEKQEFRTMVQKSARNYDMEVNYHEAVNNCYLAYTEKTVEREHVQGLLETAQANDMDAVTPLLQALLQFLDNHNGQAPLQGTLPDMTADTQSYVHLQGLYKDQSVQDLEEMKGYCNGGVSDDDLQSFCHNVFDLDILVLRTLEQEYTTPLPDAVTEELQSATWDPHEQPEHTPLLWYIGLRACHLFYLQKGRYPGVVVESDDDDVSQLQTLVAQVASDLSLADTELVQSTLLASSNCATELCRYANAELHTIASVVGGVASQEAVKLITGIYVPLNNVYIYNGIASVGGVYTV